MKSLLLGLFMAVLVTAKPELYREKEDFQYSRSSTDEGSKSGYYDAQRGNMGGNYERAHNMDGLAQHQMGGLVKQVEGELGDGSKTRTGSVFTAANSQGIYGSGRYDLSNLEGRNFQEGATFHDSKSYLSAGSQAHSSQYSAHNNARYNADSQLHSSGFGDFHQSDNLQEAQNSYGTKEYEHGSQSQRHSKYYLQSGYQGSSDYERSNTRHQASNNFEADTHNRLISQVPVRIVVRPGTRVAIPLATQTHSGSHAASYDQSSVNSEAEVLNSDDQQAAFRPNGDAKHYESSYSYRKEWEKHDTKPATVPLATPVFPISKNSELYDESRSHHGSEYAQNTDYNLESGHVRQQAGFNSQHSALSSDSQHQADYNSRQHTTSSNLNSNAYSHSGYDADANSHSANIIGTITSKPKSYQSSYSYHKSWERQGDPYVIIPPSNGAYTGQTSQRLTDVSGLQGEYSSQNYGSRKSHQTYSIKDCVIECDPNRRIRVARSYNSDPAQFEEQNQNVHDVQETWGQQSISGWEGIQHLSQQSQNLYNSGQQTQNNWDNLEDLGQQTQTNWGNLEQLGQQTQNKWEQQTQDAGQHIEKESDNLEDLGQQAQNNWEQQAQDAEQQIENKSDNLEDLGQQTENKWEQQTHDVGQQVQNKWDNLEDLGQQTQNKWEQSQDGQLTEKKWDLGQQTQSQLGGEIITGQEILNGWNNLDAFGQQSEMGQEQQTQDNWDTQKQAVHTKPIEIDDLSQQHTQAKQNPLEEQVKKHQFAYEGTQQTGYENQHGLGWWPDQFKIQEKPSQTVDLSQQTQDFDTQQTQMFDNQNIYDQTGNHDIPQGQALFPEDMSQQPHGSWKKIENTRPDNKPVLTINNEISTTKPTSHTNTHGPKNTGSLNSLWGKLDEMDGDIAPSNLDTFETQNTDFAQTSGFNGSWGKLDENIAPSSVNALQTQNTDFSQTSSSFSLHNNWQQQSLFNKETGVGDQHLDHHSNKFDMWSRTNDPKNNMAQYDTTFEVFNEQSTTENRFLTTGLFPVEKKMTTTTEKSLDEDKIRTIDFGRGDIGPEDSLIELLKSTTGKTLLQEDNFSHKYTTVIDNDQQYQNPNKKDELINEPTRKIIQILDEQPSPKPIHILKTTQSPYQDVIQNNNKPSDTPYKAVANNEAPEEIEQQFETQNVLQEFQLHNEQKTDGFEQNHFQHQGNEQNIDFGNFEGKNPDPWVQDLNQQQTNGDLADQQFIDFSQSNQQWHAEQQNIQHQFPDDFYQQNQQAQFQTGDFEHHNAGSTLPDLGQQNVKKEYEILPTNRQPEKNVRTDYVEDLGQQPNTNDMLVKNVSTTPQPVAENPGFWRSVGYKFVSAKNKVASWFS